MSSFIDSFEFSVDRKGRFSVPVSLRQGLAVSADGTFIVSKGPDGCLDAYPLDEWTRRVKVLRSIPNKKLERYYKRMVLGGAVRCKMDSHNRILVPPALLRSVGIEGTVVIIGQLDHLEFWDPKVYQGYLRAMEVPLEDILEQIDTQLGSDPGRRPGRDW
jgi:MraZ protein